MKLFDRVKAGFAESLDSSKKMLKTAKAKTQELEEVAVINLDLKRLEARTDSLFRDLGMKVYSILMEEKLQTLSVRTPGVKDILQQLGELQALREDKKNRLIQGG